MMVPQVRIAFQAWPSMCRSSGRDGGSTAYKQEELPILEALINIRIRLTALKKVSAQNTPWHSCHPTWLTLRIRPNSSARKM
jgi:hypothetical protein